MENLRRKIWNITNLKETFFPTLAEDGSVILDYYVRIMLFFYPLFLVQDQVLHVFTGKSLLYYAITLLSAVLYLFFLSRKMAAYASGLCRTECLFLLAALLLMSKAVVRIFQGDMGYEKEMFLWCVIGTYFLLKSFGKSHRYYLDLILFSALLLQAGAIKFFIWGGESIPGVDRLCTWPEAGASYYLLAACAASVRYCGEKRKNWEKFYLLTAAFGYLTLFLLGDMGAICLAVLFLLTIPLVYPATVFLVKRNLTLCFGFLLIGSNLPLLSYGKNSLLAGRYDLKFSISIGLFLCAAGLFISKYWEKIPRDRNPDAVILKRFRRWYGRTMAAVILLMAVCLLEGNGFAGLPERLGVEALKAFAAALGKGISGVQGFPAALLEDYGMLGFGLWISIAILLLEMVKKRWREADETAQSYLMLSGLFLAQTFLYRIQPISGPAYVIVLTLALGKGRKTERLQTKRRDFQQTGKMRSVHAPTPGEAEKGRSRGGLDGGLFEKDRKEDPGI